MIAWLSGKILIKNAPQYLVDVSGVGYDVWVPMRGQALQFQPGDAVELFCHTVIREDNWTTFGFEKIEERDCFRELIKITGVGPKMALTLLTGFDLPALSQVVEARAVGELTKLPGVGKKTAERLLVELADRLPKWLKTQSSEAIFVTQTLSSNVGSASNSDAVNTGTENPYHVSQAGIDALVALGYKPQDAEKRVRQVMQEDMTVEVLIKTALQS